MAQIHHDPRTLMDEAAMLMAEFLGALPSHDREALRRFYLDGQPHEEIEAALGLDADHFHELALSARRHFSEFRPELKLGTRPKSAIAIRRAAIARHRSDT